MGCPRPVDLIERLREVAQAFPGLDALILYGARARGDATPHSDWDLGYLASGELDAGDLHALIVEVLGDDRVDLVDLARAGGRRRAHDLRAHAPERRALPAGGYRLLARHGARGPRGVRGSPREALPVSPLDRDLLAERAIALERHLRRVAERLPFDADDLHPESDASDALVLHLWQATQIAIDLATATCVKFELGTPGSYADAFARLRDAEVIGAELARRPVKAAGFRKLVAHADERLDMRCVHDAALHGPADLGALLAAVSDRLPA